MPELTPSQTVGPFFDFALAVAGTEVIGSDLAGERITIEGALLDGAGEPVPEGLIEIWQADGSGTYAHPADPRSVPGDSSFRGFGRCGTDTQGRYVFETVVPGRVPGPHGLQAPHLLVSVFARGVLTRLVTRMYFEDQRSNDEDPILRLVPEGRRRTLMARPLGGDRYQFNVVLQGEAETVFFDV